MLDKVQVVWRLILAQTEQAVPVVQQAAESTGENGAGGGTGGAPPGNPLGGMLPMIIAFIAIMYFLMIRPQQKREKERKAMLAALAKGDTVVTTGGICGTVTKLTDETVTLRVDDNVTMKFLRGAISQVNKQ